MVFQNFLPELVPLAMKDVFPSHPLRCKIKASDAAEK
jgi:hypothetical protein